jgi:hypothetical protein
MARAVRMLTSGLAAGPMSEPASGRAAEAARRAHELLLAAESAPPGTLPPVRLARLLAALLRRAECRRPGGKRWRTKGVT